MHAFKNIAQLPHTKKSKAEKGQKDSINYRIRKTVSERSFAFQVDQFPHWKQSFTTSAEQPQCQKKKKKRLRLWN